MTSRSRPDSGPAPARIQILPATIDNSYRGARIALWFFVAMTALTVARSVVHIVAPDGGAQSIATIPLDSFTANGAAVVIHLFALWGLSQLVVGVLYVVVAIRYCSLIPLMYLLALVEYSVRLVLTFAKPMEIEGTAPGAIGNWILIPLLAVMLVLSLVPRRERQSRG